MAEILLGRVVGEQGPVGPQGQQGESGPTGTSLRFMGEWSPEVIYVSNTEYIDFVTSDGSTYICKADNMNQSVTNTSYWQVMAQKGDTGEGSDSAETANRLATPRLINGVAFDGSKDITAPAVSTASSQAPANPVVGQIWIDVQ